MILRIYDATVCRLQCCFIPLYVSTAHFAFTPLYDSMHLDATVRRLAVLFYTTVRLYASTLPCLSLLLHGWTILRIYDATVCRVSVLFYITVRFYASTFLWLTLLLHKWTILRIYDATVRRLSVLFYTTVSFYASTFLRLTLHCNNVLNRSLGLN